MLLGSNDIKPKQNNNIQQATLNLKLSSLEYGSTEHFNISVQLSIGEKSIKTTALIDSGATGNFMHIDFVKQYNIPQELKEYPIPLEVVDGRPISTGHITHSTPSMHVLINQDHTEKISLDIAPIGRHQLILGIPWLKQHNPAINWQTHSIQFESDYCKAHCNIHMERTRPPYSIDVKSLLSRSDVEQILAIQNPRQAIKKVFHHTILATSRL